MLFLINKRYKRPIFIALCLGLVVGIMVLVSLKQNNQVTQKNISSGEILSGRFNEASLKSESEWKQILTPAQFHILREAGTEVPFSGELNKEKRQGIYYSVGCDKPLFSSDAKYDSGTGWPSFWAPIDENSVVLRKETNPGDDRIEVLDTCGGHLGHVFNDGPQPTGKRYCMNSIALRFVLEEK